MDGRKTILVIDDNPDMLTIVSKVLEGEDYRIKTFRDCCELFAFLNREQPHLIILDLMLPEMDGISALRKLKQSPSLSSIPVIISTAKGCYSDILEGYQSGADYYINKPFTKSTLINGVKLVLRDRKENVSRLQSVL